MRKKIVAGNWKMNKTLGEGIELARDINDNLKTRKPGSTDVILFTPFTHIFSVSEIVDCETIHTGAQNCSSEESGAFTGEVSPKMIRSAGAHYVLIGHSERRSYFGEDDNLLKRKVETALNNNLKIVFCCGEVLKERESGVHFSVIDRQLKNGLFGLPADKFSGIIIAYEPVWAIGTGVTASSGQAQEMHQHIRETVAEKYGELVANNTTILYGGSCNPVNAKELFSMKDVDGGLIGGASLKSDDFCKIVESF